MFVITRRYLESFAKHGKGSAVEGEKRLAVLGLTFWDLIRVNQERW